MQHEVKLDQQIYDDLTLVFRLFKKKIMLLQQLLLKLSEQPTDDKIQQVKAELKDTLEKEIDIIDKYTKFKQELIAFRMIFYRFFSRLIELVEKEKKRVQTKIQTTICEYFEAVECIIYKTVADEEPDYINALILIHEKSKKYTKAIIIRIARKNNSQTSEDIFFHSFRTTDQCRHNAKTEQSMSTPKYSFCTTITQNQMSTTVSKLNSSLNALSILDISYVDCRAKIVHIKNNPEQHYDQQIQRNSTILKEINNYSKSFLNYQVKKAKKSSRTPSACPLSRTHNNSTSAARTYTLIDLNQNQIEPLVSQISTKHSAKQMSSKVISQKNYNKTLNLYHSTTPVPQKQTVPIQTNKFLFNFNKKTRRVPEYVANYAQVEKPKKQQQQSVNIRRKLKTVSDMRKRNMTQNLQIVVEGHKINQKQFYKAEGIAKQPQRKSYTSYMFF